MGPDVSACGLIIVCICRCVVAFVVRLWLLAAFINTKQNVNVCAVVLLSAPVCSLISLFNRPRPSAALLSHLQLQGNLLKSTRTLNEHSDANPGNKMSKLNYFQQEEVWEQLRINETQTLEFSLWQTTKEGKPISFRGRELRLFCTLDSPLILAWVWVMKESFLPTVALHSSCLRPSLCSLPRLLKIPCCCHPGKSQCLDPAHTHLHTQARLRWPFLWKLFL